MAEPSEAADEVQGYRVVGSIALAFGVGVFCLAVIEGTGAVPFDLPRSWYVNRSLWLLLGLSAIAAGCAALRGRRESTATAPAFRSVTLYTRGGCHLCDEARAVLNKYAAEMPEIAEVDIDSNPDLQRRFGECVPVVEIDGTVRFRGRVNEILLRRLIAHSRDRV